VRVRCSSSATGSSSLGRTLSAVLAATRDDLEPRGLDGLDGLDGIDQYRANDPSLPLDVINEKASSNTS
jgi:hypothetical protein